MNDINKKIIELRQLGYGYKKIANELSITASAVRYVCSKSDDEKRLTGYCKYCGAKTKSVKGKKKKVFCSDKCRWKWWNEKRKGTNKHDTL